MIYFFIKGLLFGCYSASIPGPIGLICIKRTLKDSKLSGIASAFGVVTAETFYAAIVIYGLTYISEQFHIHDFNFLFLWKSFLQLLGSLFLLYLGYTTFFSVPDEKTNLEKNHSLFYDYISITLLTIIHPMLVINFVIIFASFGLSDPDINFYNATIMLLGFTIGSASYYLTLVGVVSALNAKFNTRLIKIINQVCGGIIITFAIFMLSRGLAMF